MTEPMTSAAGHGYLIRVHQPDGDPPTAGFPVIWLLDAPTTWPPMQQALNESGSAAIVVGIDWDNDGGVDANLRRRDFTLPARHAIPPPRGSADDWICDGDAEAFLAFLIDRVRPHCLRALPINARRQTLAGHSLSGLFVLLALMRRPDAFGAYVAASPSLWWDEGRALAEMADADLARAHDARVLMTVGSEEQTEGPEKPPAIDGEDAAAMLGQTHMIANATAMAELLQSRGLSCELRLCEGEGHHSVLPWAMAAALAFAGAPPHSIQTAHRHT